MVLKTGNFISFDIYFLRWIFGDMDDFVSILDGDYVIWDAYLLYERKYFVFLNSAFVFFGTLFIFGTISVCIFDDLFVFGMVYFWGPTVRGPICHFSRADNWAPGRTVGPRTTGTRGPTVRGPSCHFLRADSWALGPNCLGPSCPGPNRPGPNLPRTIMIYVVAQS